MDNSPILLGVARRLRSDEVSSGNEESSRRTDIHTAARRNNLKVVQACVNNDAAKRDAKTADGETPLMIAALNGCLEVVDWLHRRGASLREVLTNGNTVVHYSAASGSTDTLQYILIQEGMGHYVNSLNKRGETPAHVAVRCGSIETLRVLFNHRADLTVMNQDSQTACDLAKALGHPECRQFLVQSEHPQPHQLPAAITTEEDPDGNVRRSGESTSPPVSLQNDERQAFHNEEGVERDLLVQGNNTSSRGRARGGNGDTAEGQSQPTIPAASSQPAKTVTEGDTRQKEQSFGGGGGNVPLAPLEPMRPKTTGERTLPAKEEQRGERGSQVHTSHSKTSLEKARKRGEEACVTQSVPVANNVVVLPHNICPRCGRRTTARTFVINKPKLIYAGETCVQEADSVQYEEQTCFYCTQEAMKAAQGPSANMRADQRVSSSEPESQRRPSGRGGCSTTEDDRMEGREMRVGSGGEEGSTARRERRGSDKSQRRRGSEIDRTHSLSMDSTDGHDATEEESSDEDGDGGYNQNLESGYFTLPSNIIPPDLLAGPERAESPSLVEIREHKIPVPARMEVKHGEYVSLYAKATPKCSQPLKYSWFTIKGGRPDRVIGTRPRLRYRVTREVKLLCRVSLKHDETVAVDSKQVAITPKLVWITSSLTMEGEQYFGRRAVLKCTAEKHPSVHDTIRYQWLRNTLPSQIPWFYKETENPTLTFDPLSPEHDGYYLCQAEVKGDFAETKPVHVQGRIEPLVEVVRQPRSWVLGEGDTLQLHCLAALRDGGDSDSLSYQWLHDDSPIHGATSSSYKMERLTVDDTGQYRCRAIERRGGAVTSEPATVALAHSQETDSTGPRSLQQKQQLRAQKVQQTEDESRYATDKVALLVGNEDYRHQSQLNSSVADVRALQEALKDAGFKVFSLVNLSCDETMRALDLICDLLVAGVYVVFAYTGHGCNIGNTDYMLPIDAHHPVNPHQCIASVTICERLQSKLCRVFMIMNCCRNTPDCSHPVPQHQRTCNYANYAILTASTEGHKAYEETGKVSTFTTAFVDALGEGSYKMAFDKVLEKMVCVHVSDGTSPYAQPTVHYSTMDPGISFHDDIMLDDPEIEEPLDKLLEMWRAANTPPGPVRLQSEELDPALDQLVEDVCLRFDCDLSNVLAVVIHWRVKASQLASGISCTVDMLDQGQGVDIESSGMQDCEAHFRISSLQRLSGNLRLQFKFTVCSNEHPELRHFFVSHDLRTRPLFSRLM